MTIIMPAKVTKVAISSLSDFFKIIFNIAVIIPTAAILNNILKMRWKYSKL